MCGTLELNAGSRAGRSMDLTARNPRRTPIPSRHVHVLQDGRKRQKTNHSPDGEPHVQIANQKSRILPREESASSSQSANKWFDTANRNITPQQSLHIEPDDEPPFYMSNHAHYIPTNFAASEDYHAFGGLPGIDSENEELRGVVDDLTVENKRLRQLIHTQVRHARGSASNVSSQEDDKLFEVRIHGLEPAKRQELEHLLQKFAISVHTTGSSKPSSATNTSALGISSDQKPATLKKGVSLADSGYASNATSDATSNIASTKFEPTRTSTTKAVRSYLKDIPDPLLPKLNPFMSVRTKQALVVRRLEQLFTGRQAGPGNHDQQKQQQEISRSAAKAGQVQDACNNKKTKLEGSREARVMPPDSKVNLDDMDIRELKEPPRSKHNKEASAPGSPDQRPTQPLDLDIHRAQLAAENVQYIRHLGLSPPRPGLEEGEQSSWMFLNLLTGLAQLHTLNVTPDFVREAVKKCSKRLEISKDGYKVRWVGASSGTKFAVEDEQAIESANVTLLGSAEDAGTAVTSSKRSQSNSTSDAAGTSNAQSEDRASGLLASSASKQRQPTTCRLSSQQYAAIPCNPSAVSSAFDYKPILYRAKAVDEYGESDDSYDSQSADSSGLVHALSRSSLAHKDKGEGHLTFYNNPYFCSDYSSDKHPSQIKPPQYVTVGGTLGIPVPPVEYESPLRYHDATYFTAQFAPKPFDETPLGEEDAAKFIASLPQLPDFEPIHEAGEFETTPLEFEVCGLGGITPEDNFALDVKLNLKPAPRHGSGAIFRQLSFSRRRYSQRFVSKVTSCNKLELLPSKLPAPSYVFFMSSSSSEASDMESESDDSDTSSSPFVDEEYRASPAFLKCFAGEPELDLDDGQEDDDESSDVDMLAIARQAHPKQVAEQERAYMINEPSGSQRVVAGSLAATVGASRSSLSIRDNGDSASLTSSMPEHGSIDEEDEDSAFDIDD